MHDALLPEGTFEAAQELIAQRAAIAPRSQSTPHLLSGVARCGRCHHNLVIHRTKLKAEGQFHVSYGHRNSDTGDKCLSIHKTAHRMEDLVLEQVRRLAETPRLRESAMAAARQELTARGRPLAARSPAGPLLRASTLRPGTCGMRLAPRCHRASICAPSLRARMTVRRRLQSGRSK